MKVPTSSDFSVMIFRLRSVLEARCGVRTEASTLLPPVCGRPERSERRGGLVSSPLGSVVRAVHQLSVVHESPLS